MDLMSSRFKSFGFGTKRNKNHSSLPSSQVPPSSNTTTPSTTSNNLVAIPSNGTSASSALSGHSSSTTSLPMNQNPLGRPPSYSLGRPTSPLPPGQQLAHHPASINTNMQYTNASPAQPMGAPPGYGMHPPAPHGIAPGMPQQYLRNPAVEVEGAGRSKAQLIVGVDFGTTFSGVAFAFATNNEAREDIITEWPGAGTHTKQKVR